MGVYTHACTGDHTHKLSYRTFAMLKAGAAALRTAAHCCSSLVVKNERRPR